MYSDAYPDYLRMTALNLPAALLCLGALFSVDDITGAWSVVCVVCGLVLHCLAALLNLPVAPMPLPGPPQYTHSHIHTHTHTHTHTHRTNTRRAPPGFEVTSLIELPPPGGIIALWAVVLPVLYLLSTSITNLVRLSVCSRGSCARMRARKKHASGASVRRPCSTDTAA
jgi:hypothetical protein